jgi:alpha-D-xyloside xylohydrolase
MTNTSRFTIEGNSLVYRHRNEEVRIEPWGTDSVRIRAGLRPLAQDQALSALLPAKSPSPEIQIFELRNGTPAKLWEHGEAIEQPEEPPAALLCNGLLRVTVTNSGQIRFLNRDTGCPLLEEIPPTPIARRFARSYRPEGDGKYEVRQAFLFGRNERLYGLGHHEHELMNLAGHVIDLVQYNTQICVPFIVSTKGYGFLWNTPALGRVEFGKSATRWIAGCSDSIDYWVTAAPSAKGILANYADATGHSPPFPSWASGFWQSSFRYASQVEVLTIAREHRQRGHPMSVIVIDSMHSQSFGEWCFDPVDWPDPTGMVKELAALGVKVMISFWPCVNPRASNYSVMAEEGLFLGTEHGSALHFICFDVGQERAPMSYYDPTNPRAAAFVWDKFRENYLSHGIVIPWLDACEPAVGAFDHENLRYAAGPGRRVGCYYPEAHIRVFSEGLRAAGVLEPLLLTRSVWAGSQRHPACLFPGDLATTFEALEKQIPAFLNLGMSGIHWWTTDIGGFFGGDPDDPYMRELTVRWAQFAVFSPVFRMHGDRAPRPGEEERENEIWSYGDEAYKVLSDLLALRERMRPLVHQYMDEASRRGVPMMRPLFLEFPDDDLCYDYDRQFLWGDDVLVAPVLRYGQRKQDVYLPRGASWTHVANGQVFEGGRLVCVSAEMDAIPVFSRNPDLTRVVFGRAEVSS